MTDKNNKSPSPPSAVADDATPQREMNTVLHRLEELEDEYRSAVNQRASKLSQQQERYSELQTAVESNTRKYKQEAQRLRSALKKSEQKQAVLAKRLAQTLQARNEDETSHLRQLINMHDEQMMTMQEGMRELLKTLGVEETVIGNLDALCGLTTSDDNNSNNDDSSFAVQNSKSLSTPAEQILYNIRRQNCELAIALRKSISIVREKLDVEQTARLEAQQKAGEFLEAATVVDQALQKAAAVILKEERLLHSNGSNTRAAHHQPTTSAKFDAVSFAPAPIHHNGRATSSTSAHHHHNHNFQYNHGESSRGGLQQQQNFGAARSSVLIAPNLDSSFGSNNNNNEDGGNSNSFMFGRNNNNNYRGGSRGSGNLNQSPVSSQHHQSPTIPTSLAVLKDITFGSLDVIRDMEKIMTESQSKLADISTNHNAVELARITHAQESSTSRKNRNQNSESRYYSPQQQQRGMAMANSSVSNIDNNNNNHQQLSVQQLQLAIDRARSAERAVAGQALLELKREIEAHQHTRTHLQKKVTFVTTQYEKLLHSVTAGEDGEYWELSPERNNDHHQNNAAERDDVSSEVSVPPSNVVTAPIANKNRRSSAANSVKTLGSLASSINRNDNLELESTQQPREQKTAVVPKGNGEDAGVISVI